MAEDGSGIIIDEGWKAQVQKEREQAAQEPETAEDQPLEDAVENGVPQASFGALVGSLATQALFSLGALTQPGQEQVMVDLDEAKFTIDLLEILKSKTNGNLSAEEEGALKEALSELQRIYILRTQQFQEQAMANAGIDPNNLRGHA